MSDFLPPTSPPPPKVPEGWAARWNSEYKEWFYVNTHTKVSQWDRPTSPVHPQSTSGAPAGPPPSYLGGGLSSSEKGANSNNPYNTSTNPASVSSHSVDADARYAAQIQAEEDARAKAAGRPTSRGASDGYYQGQQQGGMQGASSYDQPLPPRPADGKKGLGGLMGKLMGKSSGSHPQQAQYGGAYGAPQQDYGGQPQGYGYGQQQYPPQQGYGGPMQGGYGGGYGGGYQQQQPPRRGGMGAAGGAALGLGGGLLGGMMIGEMMDGNDGGGNDGGYGSDGGGGDMGGGDGDF